MKPCIITDQITQNLAIASKTIRDHGLHLVELHGIEGKSVECLSEKEAQSAKALLDQAGLKTASLATTLFFMAPLYDDYEISLFKPEFAVFRGSIQDHLKQLEHACRLADIFECSVLRVFPFRFPDNRPGKKGGTEEDLDKIAKIMKQAADIAAAHGKVLVLENCPYSHLPKGKMTQEIVRRVNSPALKMLWDPGNSYRAEVTQVPEKWLGLRLEEEFQAVKDDIGHMHLKNYHYDDTKAKPFVHVGLLEGDIDYGSLLPKMAALNAAVSLEPELEPDACVRDMDVLVQEAREMA
ncbi:sugar phosphate isomerase/epimerase family protein [Faecalibaculum rodentium]|jgi:sugar phosphate isomerase/epimerase|uniref:sugar phosphate isomerase/epimerase family protein n=1 Tax=Faecalibaculum rodentium TaxID=1702221 RepID=UPI001C3C9DA3|nr:sugar phosphate isomerase/epimerase family protein [Faecalibaculum rodentium]